MLARSKSFLCFRGGRRFASTQTLIPSVRRLLHVYDINATSVAGSGHHKRLLKGDVLGHIQKNKLQPKQYPPNWSGAPVPVIQAGRPDSSQAATATRPPTVVVDTRQTGPTFTDIPTSSMRQTIAKRLTTSKTTVPHAYMNQKLVLSEVNALRKQFAERGLKLSINDFVVKAVGIALQRVPAVNVQWDAKTEEVKVQPSVDISIAVAIPNGLITPIIKSANFKSISHISNETKELAATAKAGKLQPDQYQGGTFSISNLGMFGISNFTAVINPPQAAILAVGGMQRECELPEDSQTPLFSDTMTVALCYDARAISQEDAASFLAELEKIVRSPMQMI